MTGNTRQLLVGRIIDEHDGNVVFYFIHMAAGLAGQCILFGLVVQIAFALGTTENFQQFFLDHASATSNNDLVCKKAQCRSKL
jgi:hypothetical protein